MIDHRRRIVAADDHAGRLLLEVRASGLFSAKALGKAGDQTANQFLVHALREQPAVGVHRDVDVALLQVVDDLADVRDDVARLLIDEPPAPEQRVIARRLFEPIRRYLNGDVAFADIQRRLTQLPLLTARYVALLAVAVIGFRTSTPWWVESHVMFNLRPTIPDFIAVLVILPVFYFTYTYFVVSDYLARLCGFIFERTGQNLQLFFGSYRAKLFVALTVVSIAPLAAIVAVSALEFLIAFLQAYVFAILTCIYLNDAIHLH